MAIRQHVPHEHIRRALQGADQLRPFILSSVTTTGKQLGGGAYGVVEELEMDGLACAGKKIYDALIDPENQGAQRMIDKYYNECSLLAELRHPHIVQFLGICFLSDSKLPVLVMEQLQGSLDELLETTPDIPVFTKLSILQDVARGLAFMHNHSPAVIHRDLTARNVLLDVAMTAKIADLGNSRIANIHPGQLAQTMSPGIPGTLVYMPPEALGCTQRYGPPLDMFSFGHLTLFTAIQVFPKDLRTPTFTDPKAHKIEGRTELQRREVYIATLEKKFGKKHSMVVFIKECLANEPARRPTARQALQRLGVMRAAGQDPYYRMNRLQLEKVLTEKASQVELQASEITTSEERLRNLQTQLQQTESEKTKLEGQCRTKDEELAVREAENEQIPFLKNELEKLRTVKIGMDEIHRGKDVMMEVKKQEIAAKQRALSEAEQQVETLATECASLKGKLEGNTEQILSLQADIQILQQVTEAKDHEIAEKKLQLAAKDRQLTLQESTLAEKDHGLSSLQQRCGLLQTQLNTVQKRNSSLEARESASTDMLAVKDAHIAALYTELKGKDRILQAKTKVSDQEVPGVLMYSLPLKWKKTIKMASGVWTAQAVVVGGKMYIGGGDAEGSRYKILEYTIEGGQWREIETPVRGFGMAVVNDQVMITGGCDRGGSHTNQVWVLNYLTSTWTQPFHTMPTARWWSSAVGYKRWVLVVGGSNKNCVEVLDTKSKRWYTASPLPSDAFRPSLTVVQDTLYVVWEKSAVSVSIPILISNAISQDRARDLNSLRPAEWQSLPNTPTYYPAITSFHGYLLTVGARNSPSSTIAMYLPHIEQWLTVAQLPTPRRNCTCVVLPETEKMMVISGQDKNNEFIKTIDICTQSH